MCAGSERGVAHDRLRIGVRVVRVPKDDAVLPEVTESPFAKPVVVACRKVTPELVDRDLQDQFRPIGARFCADAIGYIPGCARDGERGTQE